MDPALDLVLRAALALLFLGAARHKLRDLGAFRATLGDYDLLPATLVPLGAALVVAAELGVAVALVGLRTPGLIGAAALLLVYAGAVGINLARGRRELDCGCAGPAARRPISGWLVVRNAAFAAAALAGAGPVRPRDLAWMDAVTVVAAVAALAALHVSVDQLLAHAPALARLRGET